MKIRETSVGDNITITLVVVNATPRETRAKKPYLALELFDGTDKINGNYWDWVSGKVPEKNSILDITCQVTEYLGTKQLNIKAIRLNTEKTLSDFEPNIGINISEVYSEAYEEASTISDSFLRNTCLYLLEQLKDEWLTVPGAKGVHHAFVGGTLVHSLSVARIARSISRCIPASNDDLCFAGGLLHDIGKLFTYKLNGVSIDMTTEGMLYDHTFIGAEYIYGQVIDLIMDKPDSINKLQLLRHIILSHHGKLEYGAAVPPMCIEAYIVHSADGVDASAQQIIEQSNKVANSMWTERIYTLNNRPQITPEYIREVFAQEEDVEDDPLF